MTERVFQKADFKKAGSRKRRREKSGGQTRREIAPHARNQLSDLPASLMREGFDFRGNIR